MSESKPKDLPITITGPVQPLHGQDMSYTPQQGGRPAANEAQASSADRKRYDAYLEKINEAKQAGIQNITQQLSYEELSDYMSLLARFS